MNGADFYKAIINDADFYNPTLGLYVSVYNDSGSIVKFYVDADDMAKILLDSEDNNEVWETISSDFTGYITDGENECIEQCEDWCTKENDNWYTIDEYRKKVEIPTLIDSLKEMFSTPLVTFTQFKQFINDLPPVCGNTYEEKLVQFVVDMQAIGLEKIMLTDKAPLSLTEVIMSC